MTRRHPPNYLRWITVAFLLSCATALVGIFLYSQAIFRSMTWPVAKAEVVGEARPVTVASGAGEQPRLQVDYEIRKDDGTYRGRGLITAIPTDRRIDVRHAPGNPANNATDLSAPGWAWKVALGGVVIAVTLHLVRALFRGLQGGGG